MIKQISLFDNTSINTLDISEDEREYLKKYVDCKIKDLYKSNMHSILVYPYSFIKSNDKVGNCCLIEKINGIIMTGNVVGFIRHNNINIRIHSRFSGVDDFFIYYMLERVTSLNLFTKNTPTSHRNNSSDLLWVFFPLLLNRALTQGVYKKYVTKDYNGNNLKGEIDVKRHLRLNIPANGKIAYRTRELSYDNSVTQLIRHTIEYLKSSSYGRALLKNNAITKDCVKRIVDATYTYDSRKRSTIIRENIRPVVHPYYDRYTALHTLCMNILRGDTLDYNKKGEKDFGILIDVSWLWEEYLNTIFEKNKLGFIHPRNREGRGKFAKNIFTVPNVHLGFYQDKGMEIPYIQPDFYLENKLVIDAKYKEYKSLLGKKDSLREDRFQLLSYMYILKLQKGMLIVPNESTEEQTYESLTLNGYGGNMFLYRMPVDSSECNSYSEFVDFMHVRENILFQIIEDMIR